MSVAPQHDPSSPQVAVLPLEPSQLTASTPATPLGPALAYMKVLEARGYKARAVPLHSLPGAGPWHAVAYVPDALLAMS
jgi:hypothetical protein